eukprot:CAMPEP_0170484564 /NCGR_PEP_ID=MMETSP0208-20121228/3986_1 /TAXON_ID=197538 /ORGANISM="Strombidium inclinatum, Strain S3" /LENGTH=71 /DNA_ID=CAMNT_0010757907 /DNA_START=501 /DNA_END=716 /DNA_ORIENTATION=-
MKRLDPNLFGDARFLVVQAMGMTKNVLDHIDEKSFLFESLFKVFKIFVQTAGEDEIDVNLSTEEAEAAVEA